MLQVQQNKAAQIVLNFPPRTSRDLMFDKLKWLTVSQLIAYHTAITVHRVRLSKSPEHLANLLCRENHNGHIILKNPKLQVYKDSFIFRGGILWNKLPRELRSCLTFPKFKSDLKGLITGNIPRFVGWFLMLLYREFSPPSYLPGVFLSLNPWRIKYKYSKCKDF